MADHGGTAGTAGDDVMAKWNYVKIGDVCTVERGGSPRPIDKFITDDPNGINWIKIGDATDSMYITETAQKIIPEGMKKSRYVQPGDFLLSNSMSFGRPYILKIDGCIHDGWLVLRDNGGVFDKRFLYYYLSSPSTYQKFKNMAVGGVVNNLNSDMIRGVTVPIPKMEEQIEIKEGQRKTNLKKVFPGYVLVKMIVTEKTWYIVRNTRGVTGFVGSGTDPIPLTDEEIRKMGFEQVEVNVDYNINDTVRIMDGPLTDFTGTVTEINKEKHKVKVLVSMFGRETPVELEFSQVQKI